MIVVLASTASTNADMLAAARGGAPEGHWIRADRQTGGRGRLGRDWASPPGNLYASTLVRLRPSDPPATGLALLAGVAVAEVAGAFVGTAGVVTLKWPNDLLAGGAKLAGMLLEREGEAVAIGIGVNLANHPALADRPATDVATLAGSAPDPQLFCEELAAAFTRWLGRWRQEGLDPVRRRWLECASPLGTALATTAPDGRVEGLFDGIEPDGSLRLRRADGGVAIVRAGDVHLL